jgi:hypothetical protein
MPVAPAADPDVLERLVIDLGQQPRVNVVGFEGLGVLA